MKIRATNISGAVVVEGKENIDNRGSFSRFFCEQTLAKFIGNRRISQINHSQTKNVGAVRGMHFQYPPHAELKIVRCIRGRVWDVLIDLRKGSPTFMRWHAEELSSANSCMLVIPEGCAHGFQVLAPDSELLYLHTAAYNPSAEGALRYDDPQLAICWPLPVTDLSERDKSHALLSRHFTGIEI